MAKSSSAKLFGRYDAALLIDLTVRVILGIFFAFAAGIYSNNAFLLLQKTNFQELDAHALSKALSIFSTALYTLTIASLYVLRLRAKNKFVGLWPAIASILGGFLMFGLLLFKPREDLPLEIQILASCIVLIGNILVIYVLTHLGRSFSILPESRKLVTKGPYNFIRHPLYVAETIVSLGVMIVFLSPGAVALVVTQFLFQLVRIHYEEKVLTKNFPEYKNYAKRTARLIPGVY
ncbi:MAG: isoprenylcysteine carboxylmethyltransferase family protein [Alphaproteobacteria bacterium]